MAGDIQHLLSQEQHLPPVECPDLPEPGVETVPVIWDTETAFVFNGTEQVPGATATLANGMPLSIVVEGRQINAGIYIANARLTELNPAINLRNTTQQFTIDKASISPILNIASTGFGVALSPSINGNLGGGAVTVRYSTNANGPFEQMPPVAAGEYYAKAIIDETQNYLGAETPVVQFSIASMNAQTVSVNWDDAEFVFNGDLQAPTATVDGHEIVILGAQRNAGSHVAVAVLAVPNTGVLLTNAVFPYTIAPKPVQVNWGAQREFVFNRMIQHPGVNLGTELDDNVSFRVINAFSEVGEYTAANNLAPFIEILPANERNNYKLIDYSVDYQIVRRPLHVVMRNNAGEISETVEISRPSASITQNDLVDLLQEFLGFHGFAVDDNGIADNESVLSGSLDFQFTGLPRSEILADGEYKLTITTDGIAARNYAVQQVTAIVTVGNNIKIVMEEPATSIRHPQRSNDGGRYGILLENAIVSDIAKISVKLPEPAQTSIRIVDNLGNVVFNTEVQCFTVTQCEIIWDLRNKTGRFVASGTYLVIAEVRGMSGRTYVYSARIGVRR
jgi:hypothetical protein